MKHIKNKIVFSLVLLGTTNQVFAMGARRPTFRSLTSIFSSLGNKSPTSTNQQQQQQQQSQPTTSTTPLPLVLSQLPSILSQAQLPTSLSLPALLPSILPAILPTLTNRLPPVVNQILPTVLNQLPTVLSQLPTAISHPPVTVATNPEPPSATATVQDGAYVDQIKTIAADSSCANYSWKNRGKAPVGYIEGVALSYSRSLCRLKAKTSISSVMSAASTVNTAKDALALYQSNFLSLPITVTSAGQEALRAVYTVGLGLGMRESSGNYCEGWDRSAGSNRSSSAAEAGVFQTSYDSFNSSPELSKLYAEYKANPGRCFLDEFKEGASCSSSSILGTGAGAEYQAFNKSCPAFATEYAMIMLRVQRNHYGPINRKEAEVIPACNQMLKSVQDLINNDPYACDDLNI